jgi:hypothetical protein
MWTRPIAVLAALAGLAGAPVAAQTPLSAIDWLSNSLATPAPRAPAGGGSDISRNAMPQDISVSGISGTSADGVGLLPSRVTGLAPGLWGQSRSADLASRFRADRFDMLPAMQDLLYTLLLAELDPPADADPKADLFLTRIDTLLALGALQQARSLLKLSGQNRPELFRRAFDVSLLLRLEGEACQTLRSTPALSPTFPARIFCLARGGDWAAAALSLGTGRALGFITDYEDALLGRFLDPVLFENDPRIAIPAKPSPLVFRLLEAIGEPLPTASLPRAYAWADLDANTGWKAQIQAAERLVRSGAIDPNQLLGLYDERRPAASGGVWDRVRTVQNLDKALNAENPPSVTAALPAAWQEMQRAELEVPFAKLFSFRLKDMQFDQPTSDLVFEIGLLSDDYEAIANAFDPVTDRQRLLVAIARGQPGDIAPDNPMEGAILDGFRADGVPVRLQSLTSQDRLGEAILRAISLFASGARGNLDVLRDALAFFRAVGLQDVARKAALQLLLLERRG